MVTLVRLMFRDNHTSGRKEGNGLFNDALNTFYLRLYGVRHMVKDHSDSERGNPLPPHRLLFLINSTIPHTTAFVTPVVEHWLEREIAQWVLIRVMRTRQTRLLVYKQVVASWTLTEETLGSVDTLVAAWLQSLTLVH